MIPHEALSNEIFGNGLKDRITACRKRLRVSRATQRAQVHNPDGLSPSPSRGSEFPADSPAMRQLVHLGLSPVFSGTGEEIPSTLLLVGDHEVGIT